MDWVLVRLDGAAEETRTSERLKTLLEPLKARVAQLDKLILDKENEALKVEIDQALAVRFDERMSVAQLTDIRDRQLNSVLTEAMAKIKPSPVDEPSPIDGAKGTEKRIQAWNVIGSHGGRWQPVDRRIDAPGGPFCVYVLEIYASQRGGTIQLGRVQFKDAHGVELPYQSHWINEERCHGGGGEHARNLSNGEHNKWCTQLEYFPNQTARLEFTFAEPVTIATLVLTSANDCPERDPSRFALFGVGDEDGDSQHHDLVSAVEQVEWLTAVLKPLEVCACAQAHPRDRHPCALSHILPVHAFPQ
jgi:hypothetical protein